MTRAEEVLPNPVFEGSEKRIEIDFVLSATSPANGLRAMSREQLDELMTLAACTIVSNRTNAHLDAYVLSESSLFVYPTKWVLKTCGTTKLLHSVPRLLQLAADIGMTPRRCKYSRANYLFPHQQHDVHSSFDAELVFLRQHLGHLGDGGCAYVLGDLLAGLQWHVYVADDDVAATLAVKPTLNFEVCMTELGEAAAQQFFRNDKFVSAERTTTDTGIRQLLPQATIDDYVFEPCGYSMNGIADGGLITIHVTPEPGFSYASVEVSGVDEASFDPAALLARVLRIFRPGNVSVAITTDQNLKVGGAFGLTASPPGYHCRCCTSQEMACGGRVSYFTFVPRVAPAEPSPKAAAAAAAACVLSRAVSCEQLPMLTLPSCGNLAALGAGSSDSDDTSDGGAQMVPKRVRV